jgi:DnaJ domain
MSDAKPRTTRFHGRIPRDGVCQQPDCAQQGEFRAPLGPGGPDGPGAWRWLCLDHVREFNAGYNYFRGMSTEEIEAAQSPLSGWERQTRAFATSGADQPPRWADFSDPLEAISGRFRKTMPQDRKDGRALSNENRRDLKTMGLDVDADRRALRTRYSELVRRYHPDRNGGDRSHEKALGDVIEAYDRLKGAAAFG